MQHFKGSWHILFVILIVLYVISLVACESTTSALISPPQTTPIQPLTTYQVAMHEDIAYGPLSDEMLDLCLPEGASTTRPGVVLIHGGGWVLGRQHDLDAVCQSLAAQGFVAASINYRLAPSHPWPAQLVDVQLAVRWLRSQAKELDLDAKRLCSYGISAGGHLAVFLGVLATIHPGDEAGLLPTESPKVSCVVDEFGPTNLTAPLNTVYQQSILHALFDGVTLQSNPALYRDASPLFYVSPNSSPMLIIQGTRDTIIPQTQSLVLQKRLQRAHIPVQYISFHGGHSFSGLDALQMAEINDQLMAYLVAQEHPEL
jgi:acetyl esterase/lipase